MSQDLPDSGDYNRDQLNTLEGIREAFRKLGPSKIMRLQTIITPYQAFRRDLDHYHHQYFAALCVKTCFQTGLSACCGFESIITFFADHVINFLLSSGEDIMSLFRALERPNESGKCVYLGETGCLFRMRPISCAMFFCEQAKRTIFEEHDEAESSLKTFKEEEKGYTWPTTPVLFDEIEKYFIRLGVKSAHLYFHQSPGLLMLKARHGIGR